MSFDQIPTDSSGVPIPAHLDGYFVISETELTDPNFRKTVVLLISHNEEGAFGLVVNRPTDVRLADVFEELDDADVGALTTFIGGPVEQHYLFTLHSGLPESAESQYAMKPVPGVVFEPVFTAIEGFLRNEWQELDTSNRPAVNFYLGYAGWGPGQLEAEIDAGAWLVLPADPDIVFHPEPTEGWNVALSRKGGLYHVIAQTGFKPSVN